MSKTVKMLFFSICLLPCLATVECISISTEKILLNDGNRMPVAIFGSYVPDLVNRKYVPGAVIHAVEAGFRHFDTATLYLTEDMIGQALQNVMQRGIVKREELFVNTKLPFKTGTRRKVIPAVKGSLKRLQLDYLDLITIHTPRNVLGVKKHDFLEVWKGLEDAKRMGLVRSIGISNFNSTNINRLLVHSKTVPAVNQIEVNPTFTNLEIVAYSQSKNIAVTGYGALGFSVKRPFNDLALPPSFDNPILVGLADKYGVDSSQIFTRYLIDRDISPISFSLNKEHIQLNIDIFGFTISPKDILAINEFDRNVKVYLVDYDGLDQQMVDGYDMIQTYIRENNLTQYENV